MQFLRFALQVYTRRPWRKAGDLGGEKTIKVAHFPISIPSSSTSSGDFSSFLTCSADDPQLVGGGDIQGGKEEAGNHTDQCWLVILNPLLHWLLDIYTYIDELDLVLIHRIVCRIFFGKIVMDPCDGLNVRFNFGGEFVRIGPVLRYIGGDEAMSCIDRASFALMS